VRNGAVVSDWFVCLCSLHCESDSALRMISFRSD